MDAALAHFIDLALRGKHKGCSGGCKAARTIARAVVDSVPRLDSQARDGLRVFVNLTSQAPGTARDLLYGDSADES
jgi:hypothetical protein